MITDISDDGKTLYCYERGVTMQLKCLRIENAVELDLVSERHHYDINKGQNVKRIRIRFYGNRFSYLNQALNHLWDNGCKGIFRAGDMLDKKYKILQNTYYSMHRGSDILIKDGCELFHVISNYESYNFDREESYKPFMGRWRMIRQSGYHNRDHCTNRMSDHKYLTVLSLSDVRALDGVYDEQNAIIPERGEFIRFNKSCYTFNSPYFTSVEDEHRLYAKLCMPVLIYRFKGELCSPESITPKTMARMAAKLN